MKPVAPHLSPARRWQLTLFLGGALLILLCSFIFLGLAKRWFVEQMPLQFYADSALQLRPGLPVRLAGIKIGEVDNLLLDDSGKVLVQIVVERHYSPFLRQNTQAALAKESFMGDSFIDLSAGDRTLPPLPDNATIEYIAATDINVVAKVMVAKLDLTMSELQKLLITLNNPDGKMHKSLENLNALLAEMRGTRVKLDKTLTSVHGMAERTDLSKTTEEANKMIIKANETLENMQTHWPFTPSSELKKARKQEKTTEPSGN